MTCFPLAYSCLSEEAQKSLKYLVFSEEAMLFLSFLMRDLHAYFMAALKCFSSLIQITCFLPFLIYYCQSVSLSFC